MRGVAWRGTLDSFAQQQFIIVLQSITAVLPLNGISFN